MACCTESCTHCSYEVDTNEPKGQCPACGHETRMEYDEDFDEDDDPDDERRHDEQEDC